MGKDWGKSSTQDSQPQIWMKQATRSRLDDRHNSLHQFHSTAAPLLGRNTPVCALFWTSGHPAVLPGRATGIGCRTQTISSSSAFTLHLQCPSRQHKTPLHGPISAFFSMAVLRLNLVSKPQAMKGHFSWVNGCFTPERFCLDFLVRCCR